MTSLLTRFLRWMDSYPNMTGRSFEHNPCSYECHSEGGCDNCASFVEWHDADYGLCGKWIRPGEETPVNTEGPNIHPSLFYEPLGDMESYIRNPSMGYEPDDGDIYDEFKNKYNSEERRNF